MSPAATLKTLRIKAGLTQQQLADKAGLDRSWLNQMERGRKPITKTPAAKLAAVLGVSPVELGAEEAAAPEEFRSIHQRLEEAEEDRLRLTRAVDSLRRRVLALERQARGAISSAMTG